MDLPAGTLTFSQVLDPRDIEDFQLTIRQGATDDAVLAVGEDVASFTLVPLAESVEAGLLLLGAADGYADPALVGLILTFWIGIDPARQEDDNWQTLQRLGLVLTIFTNNAPQRIVQRTIAVSFKQQ